MAETEVESILREIRERVLTQQRAGQAAAAPSARLDDNNGAAASEPTPQIRPDNNEPVTSEKLSLINSYLATTARAWDRLPPLVSNRSGITARIELWIKRRLKRGSRWFTWEQVNFNAAIHQTLRDLLPVIAAQQNELLERLKKLQAQLAKSDARQSHMEQDQATMTTKLAQLQAGLEAQRQVTEKQANQVGARFAELAGELRERDERLQEEQRVCLKQLALETSEAAALEDRARRKTEALVEELQRRVAEMEKK